MSEAEYNKSGNKNQKLSFITLLGKLQEAVIEFSYFLNK